jgi:hypothetical protein
MHEQKGFRVTQSVAAAAAAVAVVFVIQIIRLALSWWSQTDARLSREVLPVE